MKFISKIFLLTLALAVPMTGCDTDELHDLNINPQALNAVDLNFIFTAAELGSAAGGSAGDNRYIDWRTNIGLCAYAIQHLANVAGGIAPGDKYTDNVETWNAPWEFIYADQLKNLAEILRQTDAGGFAEGKNLNLRQATRILRAFNFHRLTDYYGNIPYSEALKGIQGIQLPKYDPQSAIYADLLKELSEAVAAISASNPDEGFTNADIIFNGDIAKWKKFGNSLILRLAMRMSNVNAGPAATYVTQAVSGGTMTANTDNAFVPMAVAPSEWTNQNGISRAFANGDGGQPAILSERLINMLKGANAASTADDDPRLRVFSHGIFKTDGTYNTDPLQQRGMPNGLDGGTLDAYLGVTGAQQALFFSRLNITLLDDDDPYMLMNAAESEFLKAEAIVRGIGTVPGTAALHYDAGVKLAMQMYLPYAVGSNNGGGDLTSNTARMTVTDTEVDNYLAARPFPATGQLEAIGNQMWLSKMLNWWDAWSDWRRTGFPVLTPVNYPGNITGGQIPRKLRLPTHEVATNAANIAAGATTPDTPVGKVWWDGGN